MSDSEKASEPIAPMETEKTNNESSLDHNAHYNETKAIVLRKAEIQANQYKGNILLKLILLFAAFLIGYGYGLDANIRYVYTAWASSSYGEHSLISTIGVINGVTGAASQIVYARLSDVFGRLTLLITSIVFYVIGTIIQSQAYDIQRYCAGSFFYNLGYVGVLLMVLLILSDVSSLRWRLFYSFVPALPYIINTWISGNISTAVGLTNWSWGIGMWAFIFPLSSLPFIGCLLHMKWLARKDPEYIEVNQRQTYFQKYGFVKSITEVLWRVDALGLFVMIVSLGCILAPLTLAAGVRDTWKSGKIIGPLVLGFVLLPIFWAVEKYIAKYPLAPPALVRDRGVWSALAMSLLLDFIYYMAADYMYTVLIVAMNQSYTSASRITSLYSFVSMVWAPFFSLVVVYVRRLKPFIILGCSLWFLACGLLYHFRGGESAKAGVIGAYVVWGIGTTMFSYPINVSLQSSVTHEHMATVTALSYTMFRIGSAIGNSVSGAIWTQLLPARLEQDLGNATLAASVYSSPYVFVTEYAWGSAEREAVVESYKYIQKKETIVAICFCALLVFFSLFLRDPVLTDKVAYDEDEDSVVSDDVVKSNDKFFDATVGKIFGRSKRDGVTGSTAPDSDKLSA
uniref:MFS transporter n=1 Tax=Cyberlindnera americana TaxID=36016 RepID=A0A5P8N8R0_9ASCO|nr:MFS transporter [Cyberlindnera americana]